MTPAIGAYLPLDPEEPLSPKQVELVLEAEELGYDRVWARDLLLRSEEYDDADQEFEALIEISYLAGVTERIGFGTAAISLPFRHPGVFARQAASLHALAQGRVILGVGTGFRPDLYPVFGTAYDDRRTRLREHLVALRELWSGGVVTGALAGGTFQGHRLGRIAELSTVPIYLAAGSPPPAELLPYIDGWLTHRRKLSTNVREFEEFRSQPYDGGPARRVVIDFNVALGNKPGSDFGMLWRDNVFPCTPEELVLALRAYARTGVSEVILGFVGSMPAVDQMRLVGAEVLPALDD